MAPDSGGLSSAQFKMTICIEFIVVPTISVFLITRNILIPPSVTGS